MSAYAEKILPVSRQTWNVAHATTSAAPAPSDAGSGPSTQPVSEPAAARASPAARNEQAHAAALDAKANGNALFKAKDYAGASAEYRRAISIEPTEKVRRRLAAQVA